MGFWKTTLSRIISGVSITVISALILPHLNFFKMWFVSRGWAIAIGIVIGTIISLNLYKIYSFFKWLFIRIYKIICGICKWLKLIFTINKLDLKINNSFREIANNYFNLSQANLFIFFSDKKDMEYIKNYYSDIDVHFSNLALYYKILRENKVELNNDDLNNFEKIKKNINRYNEEYVVVASEFLSSFKNFLQYCKKTNKSNHIDKVNEIWDKLRELFSDKKIEEAIKRWESRQ